MQYYIYQQGFGNYEFGYASALSVVLMVILSLIALAQLRLFRADQSDLA
jgi:multiple sugar transport system permease protein